MPVRTLLLTDLVDSTALAERLGTAAAADLGARHDRIARDLLVRHDGREIDKTDGFLFLFEDPAAAAAYALAYHRALEPLEVRARAGLHVGEVLLRENPAADVARGAKPLEVEGLAKSLAARVMGIAVGGQTLATAAAVEALGLERTPPVDGRVAVSHGHWRLKGVSEPVELFELAHTKDRAFPPPPDGAKAWRVVWHNATWVPVRETKHALPAERDAFVGRDADLRALADQLDGGARLVTLLGLGGTGKTRLALHFAWTWLGQWPGGAWFCDLSEARGVEGIASAVATALDVLLGKDDPMAQLGHALAGRGKCLVVLDNFEQVARLAPETLGRWLDRAKDAQFVVTTREVLGLPGEQAIALPPLGEDDAIALFVARARSAKRDFALTAADRPRVQALVKLLDGLPLAVELAAARVRVMPPKTLLERMDQRFKLLASSGGRHTRHATLRATLDWSWDLLTADEQAALAQLSVFEGGFTLEAAEAVLTLGDLWPTDAVQGLVDKSLVRPLADDRFDQLVSVQEYAAEKLEAAGGRDDAEARHGAWFATFGSDEAIDALSVHGGGERLRALHRELDNFVAACRRATARGDGAVAVGTLLPAWEVLEVKGPYALALALAAGVGGVASLTAAERERTHGVWGMALSRSGRHDEAQSHVDAALALARELGDRRRECVRLGKLGGLQLERRRMGEAAAHFDAALRLARELGDRRLEGVWLGSVGRVHRDQGRMDPARAHFDAALVIAREVGDRRLEALWLSNLGQVHQDQGRKDEALAHNDAALVIAREVGDRRLEGTRLGNLGYLYLELGRVDEAWASLDAALALARQLGDRRDEGFWLGNLASLHFEQGRLDEARARFQAALAVARELGDRLLEEVVLSNLGNLHLGQGRVDEARASYDAALVLARELGERRGQGILLGNLGNLDRTVGDAPQARARLLEALAIHREIGFTYGQPYWLYGLALVDAAEGSHDQAIAGAQEAVTVASEYPFVQAEALSALSRVLLWRGDVAGAREAVDRGRRLNQAGAPALLLAAVDALVCEAEGDRAGCLVAIALAGAGSHGHVEVQRLLQPLRERMALSRPSFSSGPG